jgi:hypothetical protein
MFGQVPGSLINGTVFSTDKSGTFEFDGTNDYINVSNVDTINGMITDSVSIEAFFNADVVNSYDVIGGLQDTTSVRYSCAFNIGRRNGAIGFDLETTTGQTRILSDDSEVAIGNWYHIVGTHKPNTTTLYINGIQEKISYYRTGNLVNFDGLVIGSDITPGRYFNGQIALFKVYNKLLSASEVLQNYNALKSRFI